MPWKRVEALLRLTYRLDEICLYSTVLMGLLVVLVAQWCSSGCCPCLPIHPTYSSLQKLPLCDRVFRFLGLITDQRSSGETSSFASAQLWSTPIFDFDRLDQSCDWMNLSSWVLNQRDSSSTTLSCTFFFVCDLPSQAKILFSWYPTVPTFFRFKFRYLRSDGLPMGWKR